MTDDDILKPYEITSLPPGFILITYRPGMDPHRCRLRPGEWQGLLRKGYSGGVIIPEGMKIDSLDEALMNDLGWYRREAP